LASNQALKAELGTSPKEKEARRSSSIKIVYRRFSMSKILVILSFHTEFSRGRSNTTKHQKETNHTLAISKDKRRVKGKTYTR
jgi:hypothetical protein